MTNTDSTIERPPSMDLFTEEQIKKLISNGKRAHSSKENIPYAHIIAEGPVGQIRDEWLISELYEDSNLAFGLHLHEKEKPELGFMNLNIFDQLLENETYLFNNLAFTTEYKISVFKYVADQIGEIVTKPEYCKKVFADALKNT